MESSLTCAVRNISLFFKLLLASLNDVDDDDDDDEKGKCKLTNQEHSLAGSA